MVLPNSENSAEVVVKLALFFSCNHNSPLKLFINNEIRYVWRLTFVYFKILKYIGVASFVASFDTYHSKLYDLLSKAFKEKDTEEHRFILDFEMKQMLNGDIPIFSLDRLDNFLEGNESLKIFEHNCIENINYGLVRWFKKTAHFFA